MLSLLSACYLPVISLLSPCYLPVISLLSPCYLIMIVCVIVVGIFELEFNSLNYTGGHHTADNIIIWLCGFCSPYLICGQHTAAILKLHVANLCESLNFTADVYCADYIYVLSNQIWFSSHAFAIAFVHTPRRSFRYFFCN